MELSRENYTMPKQKREEGFTLIEVIAVMIVIGIASVVVFSRGRSTDEVNIKAQAEALRGHIRYIQIRAMNTTSSTAGCSASFGISMSPNSYYMFKKCSKADADKVILPGADNNVVTLKNVTLSASYDVTFNDWGVPCSDLSGVTPYANNIVFNLGGTEPITITKNTGFVPSP